jgi:hypothetical protein
MIRNEIVELAVIAGKALKIHRLLMALMQDIERLRTEIEEGTSDGRLDGEK